MKVHFLGIGGIGVSALAQYYLAKEHIVSGSDLISSETTDYLKKLNIEIYINPKVFDLNPDLVIFSPAIKQDNTELKFYKDRGVKCFSYPEALGELTKEYFTIAVSGSHGKSTTTSMLALSLINASLDPTVIVGTKLKEFNNSNFRLGKSNYLVVEACEHEESFLSYWPRLIVITNIEAEHLDYYKNLKNVIRGFQRFINHLPKDGILIVNKEDKNTKKLKTNVKIEKFSIKQKEAKKIKKILQIPGIHNIYNALAVLNVTRELEIEDSITLKSLSEYQGSWRRFETKKDFISQKETTIISDYGHHPTEVQVTLKATREKFPRQKIWCIFQPHQYQRTFLLFKDFVKVFKSAKIDNIIITDIYGVAGRENNLNKVSSEKLVSAIKKKSVIYIPQLEIENFVKQNIKKNDVLLIMGAGDIYKLYDKF
jgi:UDP-N-acetylmuramate--alanine ligase